MSRATQPAQQPDSIPQDPNTGPRNRATEGRKPGKGEYPNRGYGTEQMSGGVPGAFGDTERQDGLLDRLPDGDEITEETGKLPWERQPKPNND